MRNILFAALFGMLIGCNVQAVDQAAEGEKLMQLSRQWSKSASGDSLDMILSYWSDSAMVMPPGQPALRGKEAIRGMVEGTSKIPGFKISWEPVSVYVSKSGDLAYMIEQNKIVVNDSTGKPLTEYNKVVTVWKKDDQGKWKNVVDMWNADPPQHK